MKKPLLTLFGLGIAAVLLLPQGADALTVSPPYFDYSLNPGDTVLDVIKIYNESNSTETFYPIIMNFGSDESEGGTPQFYPPQEDRMGTGLADWITVSTEPITVGPEERANLQFAINVPADDVQPGGHYGSILLSTSPPVTDGVGVGVASQLATIILVRVAGEVREIGSIAEFGFKDPAVWYNYLPVDFFLRFENSGNTHLRPTGNLLIEDMWGRRAATVKVNSDFKSVLPMSIRRYEFGWQKSEPQEGWSELKSEWKNFALGKHKATLILNYGSTNQVVTAEREFYVWPWRLMTIFGIGIILLLIMLTVAKRQYDKSLIRKFEKMKGEPEAPAKTPKKDQDEKGDEQDQMDKK
ncbi:hypothetical protein ACFL26_00270 [Patescibacteria group bacterium]